MKKIEKLEAKTAQSEEMQKQEIKENKFIRASREPKKVARG